MRGIGGTCRPASDGRLRDDSIGESFGRGPEPALPAPKFHARIVDDWGNLVIEGPARASQEEADRDMPELEHQLELVPTRLVCGCMGSEPRRAAPGDWAHCPHCDRWTAVA